MKRLFGDRKVRQHGDPSGLAVAERARDRGKVAPTTVEQVHQLTIALSVRGTAEHLNAVASTLAYQLDQRPDVISVTVSAIERAA